MIPALETPSRFSRALGELNSCPLLEETVSDGKSHSGGSFIPEANFNLEPRVWLLPVEE